MKKVAVLMVLSLAFNPLFSQTQTGETLQSVTDRGNITTTAIIAYKNDGKFGLASSNGVDADVLIGATTPYASSKYGWIQSSVPGLNLIFNPDNGGNVGIGTTSPTHKLTVNGSGHFYRNGDADFLLLDHSGTQTWRHGISTANTSTYVISNDLGGESANKILALTNVGNVGIGTTSPDAKLRVNASSGTALKVIGLNGYLTIDNVGAGYNYYNANAAHDFQINGATKLLITSGGNVGVGTSEPGSYKLAVEGTIGARKIKITQQTWADYVFDSSYQLPSLTHVESFIKENKHLPEVPSAAEVKKDGLDLGENQAVLLKKIEELTLYIIDQNKQINQQNKKIENMEKQMTELQVVLQNTNRH